MKQNNIEHDFMARIALYLNSHNANEVLSLNLFNDTFGSVMGKHYHDKWFFTYKRNFMQMTAYYGLESDDGQRFCDMIALQMQKYEERINR